MFKKFIIWTYGKRKAAKLWMISAGIWSAAMFVMLIVAAIADIEDISYPFWTSGLLMVCVLPIFIVLIGKERIAKAENENMKVVESDAGEFISVDDFIWKEPGREYRQIERNIFRNKVFQADILLKDAATARLPIGLEVSRKPNQEDDAHYKEIFLMGDPWELIQKRVANALPDKEEEIRSLLQEKYDAMEYNESHIRGPVQNKIADLLLVGNPYKTVDAVISINFIPIMRTLPSE